MLVGSEWQWLMWDHINSVKFTLVSYYAMQPPGITQTLRMKSFPKISYPLFTVTEIMQNDWREFLVNKTNRCTEFHLYWYYYSTCFGQPFCPSSGVLSRTSALVHFMQLCELHKMYQSRCMAKNSWWWAERLPETCRVVIPIKLEFSASVGFIHKKSVSIKPTTLHCVKTQNPQYSI